MHRPDSILIEATERLRGVDCNCEIQFNRVSWYQNRSPESLQWQWRNTVDGPSGCPSRTGAPRRPMQVQGFAELEDQVR
jgi:hypothetical protein